MRKIGINQKNIPKNISVIDEFVKEQECGSEPPASGKQLEGMKDGKISKLAYVVKMYAKMETMKKRVKEIEDI